MFNARVQTSLYASQQKSLFMFLQTNWCVYNRLLYLQKEKLTVMTLGAMSTNVTMEVVLSKT